MTLHGFHRGPALACIVADKEATVGMIHHPGPDQQRLGIGFIDHDVVQHQIVALRQFGQPLPARATIFGLIHPAVRSAQV